VKIMHFYANYVSTSVFGDGDYYQAMFLLIEFFDDGERWIKGKLDDGAGNRCLVGALRGIRDGHNLHGAPTRVYLLKTMQRSPKTGWTGLISWISANCTR
jgi:hypothetical protein